MIIIKHGKTVKKNIVHIDSLYRLFKCKECKCEWAAGKNDYKSCSWPYDVWDSYISKCPNCNTTGGTYSTKLYKYDELTNTFTIFKGVVKYN